LVPENDSEWAFTEKVQQCPHASYEAPPSSDLLRAEFVGETIRQQKWGPESDLKISGATIKGTLELTSMTLPTLVLQSCTFGTLKLDNSRAPSIELQQCEGQQISASGLAVSGDLAVIAVSLSHALVLRSCTFGNLKLDDSHAPSIELQQCEGQQISASRLAISGDLAVIAVSLSHASSAPGSASPGDSERDERGKAACPALDCYRLKAGGDVELHAVTVEGPIDFTGAVIQGKFTCSGSLSSPGEVALICDGMKVGGSMHLGAKHNRRRQDKHDRPRQEPTIPGSPDVPGGEIEGGVRLVGADIGGEVNLTDLKINNAGGMALDAEHLTVGSHLYLDKGFKAVGLVKLAGAKVGRQVNCTDGNFCGSDNGSDNGWAINADGLVTDSLYLNSSPRPSSPRPGDEPNPGDEPGFSAVGGIRLVGAKVRQVLCSGATITSTSQEGRALSAERIEAESIYLDLGFAATGAVELMGACIRDRVACTKGKFNNPDSKAIHLDGAKAARLLFDGEFEATGEVSLIGATASVELNCTSGTFYNPGGRALTADRSTCGEVYLNRNFKATGTVSFNGATLTHVDCRNGSFLAGAQPATTKTSDVPYGLDLSETMINGHVDGREMKVEGGLSLTGAHILRDLNLKDACICPRIDKDKVGDKGIVLDGHGLTVGGTLRWPKSPTGRVDVSYATVGRLPESGLGSPGAKSGGKSPGANSDEEATYDLNGFRYGGFEEGEEKVGDNNEPSDKKGVITRNQVIKNWKNRRKPSDEKLEERLAWLNSAKQFSPQPYEELARVYREAGQQSFAQRVVITEERQRRKQGKLSRTSRFWNWFLDVTVGYGYKPHRILIGFAVVAFAGFFVFQCAQHQGVMEAVAPTRNMINVSADKCSPNYPCFYPAIYSAELLLPVVNLHQIEFWLPDMHKPWGLWYLWFTWIAIVLGWAGVTALVGGLSRIWQRR